METHARAADDDRVLVLTEDEGLRAFFASHPADHYDLQVVEDEVQLQAALGKKPPASLILLDLGDSARALEVRDRLTAAGHDVPVAVIMETGDEVMAVEALRHGFLDYIVKRKDRLEADLMARRITSNLELVRLKKENEALQRAIEESQQRLFNVYDSLDDVIMQIDEDCRVVSLNRSAAALANCEPRDAVGRVCHELFDFYPCERRSKKESCPIYRTFIEGETIRGERLQADSGTHHQYMTFITTLNDRDYTVYRETDVSEKRRLEKRIADALRSLGVSPDAADDPGGDED